MVQHERIESSILPILLGVIAEKLNKLIYCVTIQGNGKLTVDEICPKCGKKVSVLLEWGFRGREWPFIGPE